MIKYKTQSSSPKDQNGSKIEVPENDDFRNRMKCNESLEDTRFGASRLAEDDYEGYELCSYARSKRSKPNKNSDLTNEEALEKKRMKRRMDKKKHKRKIQEAKEKAKQDLEQMISQIYQLRTKASRERMRIGECLTQIQKNENKFYEFINTVIREQVEIIKQEMRVCLAELGGDSPNYGKVPILYEQFSKVMIASPEVEFIINYFIKIIAEKNKESPRYHKDLDKKTLKFLLITDLENRTNFQRLIHLREDEQTEKFERQIEMIQQMKDILKEKNLIVDSSETEESEDDEDAETMSYNDEEDDYEDDEDCESLNCHGFECEHHHRENFNSSSHSWSQKCGHSQSQARSQGQNQSSSRQSCGNSNMETQYYKGKKEHLLQTRLDVDATKSSERAEEDDEAFSSSGDEREFHHSEISQMDSESRRVKIKRRRKNKPRKLYDNAYEHVFERIEGLEKSLASQVEDDRLPCNVEEEWLQKIRSMNY